MKVWKGLYFAVWMADKRPVQQENWRGRCWQIQTCLQYKVAQAKLETESLMGASYKRRNVMFPWRARY